MHDVSRCISVTSATTNYASHLNFKHVHASVVVLSPHWYKIHGEPSEYISTRIRWSPCTKTTARYSVVLLVFTSVFCTKKLVLVCHLTLPNAKSGRKKKDEIQDVHTYSVIVLIFLISNLPGILEPKNMHRDIRIGLFHVYFRLEMLS